MYEKSILEDLATCPIVELQARFEAAMKTNASEGTRKKWYRIVERRK